MMSLDEAKLSHDHAEFAELLKKLEQHPDIQSSPDLQQIVRHAIAYHEHFTATFTYAMSENRHLAHQLSELQCSISTPDGKDVLALIEGYKRVKNAGGTPCIIYELTQADGLEKIDTIKALRSTFDLHLEETLKMIAEFENSPLNNS